MANSKFWNVTYKRPSNGELCRVIVHGRTKGDVFAYLSWEIFSIEEADEAVCEQIEKMAKYIWHKTSFQSIDDAKQLAADLYIAGYRKQSDTAKEILAILKQHILENCCVTDDDVDSIWKKIAELEKIFVKE